MLHNGVVLYRRTIAFSHIESTNHKSRLNIPTAELVALDLLVSHAGSLAHAALDGVVALLGADEVQGRGT